MVYKRALGTLVVWSVALLGSTSLAHAMPTYSISAEGLSNAQSAEQTFLNGYSAIITETFNSGYTLGLQQTSISSQSGQATFTSVTPGANGLCDATKGSYSYKCDKGLAVLDKDASPFNGRFGVAPYAPGNNWLDSMDAQELRIDLIGGYRGIGFYMTDPNDADGRFDIGSPSGEVTSFYFNDIFGKDLGNKKVYYISLFDQNGIDSFSIFSNHEDDGYGIDNFTLAMVPEPGTLGLFGIGLLGLGMARRRIR